MEQLTKDWSESWRDKQELLEKYSVDINRDRAGFLVHSLLPHLVTLDRDVLSTGVTFYHLRVHTRSHTHTQSDIQYTHSMPQQARTHTQSNAQCTHTLKHAVHSNMQYTLHIGINVNETCSQLAFYLYLDDATIYTAIPQTSVLLW